MTEKSVGLLNATFVQLPQVASKASVSLRAAGIRPLVFTVALLNATQGAMSNQTNTWEHRRTRNKHTLTETIAKVT